METRLYVGNLAHATTAAEIRQLFAGAGQVSAVELIQNGAGRSKGFAFVTMSTPAEARAAISRFNDAHLGGRALTVNLAQPREPQPPQKSAGANARNAPAAGYQSKLSAFGPGEHTRIGQARQPGGYQSKLGAFGDQSRGPAQPRRRTGHPRPKTG